MASSSVVWMTCTNREVISRRKWLREHGRKRGALSSAWMFEMAAGAWWCSSVACGGKGFCVAIWLAMAMALVTKATQNFELEGQLLENSISKKCTYMNHLDECSFPTVLNEHMGIAGLALNSRCMLPLESRDETQCSRPLQYMQRAQ